MQKLLLKVFVKDYENTADPQVREAYGKLAGTVGIVSNTVVSVLKIAVGMIFSSISIMADGLNNLAEAN